MIDCKSAIDNNLFDINEFKNKEYWKTSEKDTRSNVIPVPNNEESWKIEIDHYTIINQSLNYALSQHMTNISNNIESQFLSLVNKVLFFTLDYSNLINSESDKTKIKLLKEQYASKKMEICNPDSNFKFSPYEVGLRSYINPFNCSTSELLKYHLIYFCVCWSSIFRVRQFLISLCIFFLLYLFLIFID